jgi:diaminopimelate decarboxylase
MHTSTARNLFDVLPFTAQPGADGRLTVGGCALADVAAEFGTPALVFDEQGLRDTAREYASAFAARHPDTDVHFASKALPCAPVLRILCEEGLCCDVASAGELAIALAAGFDPAHILLHGNAKSDRDIGDAVAAGVGVIVIDGPDDVDRLERLATSRQRVLLRVNPAVPGVTHAAMDTGSPEAKFGVSLDDAPALLERIAAVDALELLGLHVHIGSQLLDLNGFGRAAEAIAALGRFPVYDLGGGLGIRYRPADDAPSIADYADATVTALHTYLDRDAQLIVEPGRSVVGPSIVTLYSVVTVKRGVLTHVAVDGGMGDNLEPMLYGQRFAPFVLDADRPAETCELVGQHCESGDVLEHGVALATPRVGDRVVMPVTGAYCYSLSNNYNGARRPPVVICHDGDATLAVRRETMDDLLARYVL